MENDTIPQPEPEEEKDALEPPLIHLDVPHLSPKDHRGLESTLDDLSGIHIPILHFGIVTTHVGVTTARLVTTSNRESLRDWWHNLLREYGRFYCYGVFLMFEADKEAIKYATEYAHELHQASGKHTAILGLGDIPGTSAEEFDSLFWYLTIYQQINDGNSLKIAEIFHIPITQFPGVILFRDIRSPEYILVKLKGLTAEQIAEKMRGVYEAINQAAEAKKNPLEAVRQLRRNEAYRVQTRHIVSGMRKLAGETLETVIEALIKAVIK